MDDEKKKIEDVVIDYKKAKQFIHCRECIEQFLDSDLNKVMTPKEYGLYEISTYDFLYPDGITEEIMVIWCKRCGRRIWDSRHFGPRDLGLDKTKEGSKL